MGLYGAGTGIDSSYMLSGPDVSLQNVMKKTAIKAEIRTVDSQSDLRILL